MFRILLTFALFSTLIFATKNFTVQLAAFSNAETLSKALKAYPSALQKTITTEKRGKLIFAYSIPTQDKVTLEKLLPSYKKVFKDAYIISIDTN